eukprot:2927973-Heterocapsa_arctica.AAC.1
MAAWPPGSPLGGRPAPPADCRLPGRLAACAPTGLLPGTTRSPPSARARCAHAHWPAGPARRCACVRILVP